MKNATRIQWIMLLLAVCAWAGVGWFGWYSSDETLNRVSRAVVTQDNENKNASAIRLRSALQDTLEQRTQIDALLHTNVVSVVNLLEAAGSAGVKVTVSDAHPETTGLSRAVAGITGLTATGFVVEARGKFEELMHVVQLLENLPVPSTIGRLELSRDPVGEGVGGLWNMSAYIRVLSTPDSKS